MKQFGLVGIALACAGLSSCFMAPKTSKDMIVGEWTCTNPNLPAEVTKTTMEFEKGGDLTMSMGFAGQSPAGPMKFTITVDGDWSIKGETLKEEATNVQVKNLTLNGQSVDINDFPGGVASLNQLKQQMKTQMAKGSSEINRIDKDSMRLTEDDGTKTKCER